MKRKMLLLIILFALTTIYPVMAQEARQPGSVDLTAPQKKMEDLDRSMMHMKEIRLQMSTVTDKTVRRKLMNEHMQMMKKMMSDMGIVGRGRTIAKSRASGMKPGTQNKSY